MTDDEGQRDTGRENNETDIDATRTRSSSILTYLGHKEIAVVATLIRVLLGFRLQARVESVSRKIL